MIEVFTLVQNGFQQCASCETYPSDKIYEISVGRSANNVLKIILCNACMKNLIQEYQEIEGTKNPINYKVSDWKTLSVVPNKNYYIKVLEPDFDCAEIWRKEPNEYVEYLTTHSFYEQHKKDTEKRLRNYGFPVEII